MSVKPIDIKTSLLLHNNASRMRDAQKSHDAGLAAKVAQNKNESEENASKVQKTDAAEDKLIKREDEEEEQKAKAKKKQEDSEDEKKEAKEENEEEEKPHPKIPDGLRGMKIDLKI